MIIALLGLGFLASCGNGTDEQPGDPDAPVNINFEFIDPPFQGAYKIGETLRFRLTIETEREGGFDIEENRFRLEYGGTLGNPTGINEARVFFDYTIEPGTKFYQEDFALLLENPFEGTGEEVNDIKIFINVLAQNNGFRFAETFDLGPGEVDETTFRLYNNYEGKDESDTTWNYNYVSERYESNSEISNSVANYGWIQNNTYTSSNGLSFVRGFQSHPQSQDRFLMANDYISYAEHRYAPALTEIIEAHEEELLTEVSELAVGDVLILYSPNRPGINYLIEVAEISDDQTNDDLNDYIEFNLKSSKF